MDALVSQVAEDHDAARLPVVSTKLPGSWAQVAAGEYDVWLHDLLDRLGVLTGPVMLSLHHEPENDVGGPGMAAADWVAVQQRAITAAQGTTITILPILMAWTFLAAERSRSRRVVGSRRRGDGDRHLQLVVALERCRVDHLRGRDGTGSQLRGRHAAARRRVRLPHTTRRAAACGVSGCAMPSSTPTATTSSA